VKPTRYRDPTFHLHCTWSSAPGQEPGSLLRQGPRGAEGKDPHPISPPALTIFRRTGETPLSPVGSLAGRERSRRQKAVLLRTAETARQSRDQHLPLTLASWIVKVPFPVACSAHHRVAPTAVQVMSSSRFAELAWQPQGWTHHFSPKGTRSKGKPERTRFCAEGKEDPKSTRSKGKPERTRFCAEGKEDPKSTPPEGTRHDGSLDPRSSTPRVMHSRAIMPTEDVSSLHSRVEKRQNCEALFA
jgi:hypothetical protein